MPWWSWALFLAGILLVLSAIRVMDAHRFTVFPEPRSGADLVVSGPYRFLRHPMYTAVLLCAFGTTIGAPSVLRWAASLGLVLVLLLKVRHEEGLLSRRYSDYGERMTGRWRLVPFIW